MPRAVLDANVLVAALLTPTGAGARLLLELRAGSFEMVASPRLLDELDDAVHRSKLRRQVTTAEAAAYVECIRRESLVIADPDPPPEPLCADPENEYLVTLARAERVDVLVTGDADLLRLADRIPVMTPRDFLDALAG